MTKSRSLKTVAMSPRSDAQNALISAMRDAVIRGATRREVAQRLGVSKNVVYKYTVGLGKTRRQIRDERDETFRPLFNRGHNAKTIASITGAHRCTVLSALKRMGLWAHRSIARQQMEAAIIADWRENRLTASVLAGRHGSTKNTVARILRSIPEYDGPSVRDAYRNKLAVVSPEEEAGMVADRKERFLTMTALSRKYGYDRKRISETLAKHGLNLQVYALKGRDYMPPADLKKVIKMRREGVPLDEMVRLSGYSKRTVTKRLLAAGVKFHKPLTPVEREFLRFTRREGATTAQIERAMHRGYAVVHRGIKTQRLKRNWSLGPTPQSRLKKFIRNLQGIK